MIFRDLIWVLCVVIVPERLHFLALSLEKARWLNTRTHTNMHSYVYTSVHTLIVIRDCECTFFLVSVSAFFCLFVYIEEFFDQKFLI